MSNGTNYSDEEIKALSIGITLVMMATTASDGVTPLGLLSESAATAKFLSQAQQKYNDNLVVLLAIDQRENSDAKLVEEKSYEELAQMIDDLTSIMKDDAETLGYKQFLVELAETVANAAGQGLFGGGVKVSPQEAEFIAALKGAFGIA